jgi:hypothetical protein
VHSSASLTIIRDALFATPDHLMFPGANQGRDAFRLNAGRLKTAAQWPGSGGAQVTTQPSQYEGPPLPMPRWSFMSAACSELFTAWRIDWIA